MIVTCGQQNTEMKRADLRLSASDKAPMHWGNYPVIALRTDLLEVAKVSAREGSIR